MPQLPTVRDVARQAEMGARRAVETWRHPTERRRRSGRPPNIPFLSRLRDRIANREFLRLRGRFRGRRGLIAFLAVMGPGLIAGVAGNDAGGITTYSVMGAQTGLGLLWIFPITIIILAVVQEIAARLGVVTGHSLTQECEWSCSTGNGASSARALRGAPPAPLPRSSGKPWAAHASMPPATQLTFVKPAASRSPAATLAR